MAKILLGMSKAEWTDIEADIDTIEKFIDAFKAMSKEAQDNFNKYVGDMLREDIHENDDTWGDISTLKAMLKIDDVYAKLKFIPDGMCSFLQSYLICQHEECECIEDQNNRHGAPACAYCFWRPHGHKPI